MAVPMAQFEIGHPVIRPVTIGVMDFQPIVPVRNTVAARTTVPLRGFELCLTGGFEAAPFGLHAPGMIQKPTASGNAQC